MPRDAADAALRRRAGSESLSAIVARLADRGRPVTCIMCTMVYLPVLDVAREHNIPVAIYWIQSATLLALSYHYFHGYNELIAAAAVDPALEVPLPGLTRPLQIRNFPSFLIDNDTSGSDDDRGIRAFIEASSRELFEYADRWRPKVLVNTFDELEPGVLEEMKRHLDVSTVGPMVGVGSSTTEARRIHLFKHDENRYTEWLHAHPEKSVVYVSFGSIAKHTKQQMDEIVGGLRRCQRPYLLVVRRDGLEEDDESRRSLLLLEDETQGQGQGMVVEWCDQLEVLSHPAVGCFVSHCGWNSTMEAVVSGVPVIAVPNMLDQPTNAYLIEEEWQVGVRVRARAERNGDGVLTTGAELARCIELVMGQGAEARAIRGRAEALKEMARAAAADAGGGGGGGGGSAERNLGDFVRTIRAARGTFCMNQNRSVKPQWKIIKSSPLM